MHRPDLKIKFSVLDAFSTDSGIHDPQRKKEIERYGEREKPDICWYSKLFKWINLGSGPPAPPLTLYSASVCFIAPRPPQATSNITVSLSFSVVSQKDANAGQSDPKQMRKEDPGGGIILEEPFFQTKHKSKDLGLVTPMTDSQVRLGLCEIVFCSFSLSNQCFCSPQVHI